MPNKNAHKTANKILVIKLGALGDFIQSLGPMAAIRNHHKDTHITLLTTAPFKSMAENCGYFNEIWLDSRPKWFQFTSWINLAKRLNAGKFTRIYDLQNNDRSSFYLKLFKNKPEWVGAAKGASHRNASPKRIAGHAYDGHVQTLALAGITNITIDKLNWMKADLSAFALKKPYILLVPGCAPSRPEKRWPAEKYGQLARALSDINYQPVLLGTKDEAAAIKTILNACPGALDLSNQTNLSQIAVLAREAAAAIGNDTGPMHLIAASGCPCITLFSNASNPVRHAPKGENVTVIQETNLENLESARVLDSLNLSAKPPAKAATTH